MDVTSSRGSSAATTVAGRHVLLELPPSATASVGLRAGLRGGLAAVAMLALIGEIAASRTAVVGIRSSTWTAITAPAALVFGDDAFHGDFHLGAIAAGLVLLLAAAALLGALGSLLVVVCLGARPASGGAVAIGVVYGLALQVVLVNVLANGVQDDDLLSRSLPTWGWWVAFGLYGLVLGLSSARLAARRSDALAADSDAAADVGVVVQEAR